MKVRIASAPVRQGGRTSLRSSRVAALGAVGLLSASLAVAGGWLALAQPAPKAQPKAAPQPKAATPQPAPAAATPEAPPLIYTPWTKVCLKGQEANAQQVCFTGKEGRIDTGMLVVGATLIEPEGSPNKILRVTLPLGMQLGQGTRVIVDQGQPMNAPYLMCFPNGCMADYEVSGELLGKLHSGKGMVVQGINSQGQAISLPLPLPDFAKAYDGPPTDPKVVEERQKKMQEDFNKKFEQQQQQQQAAPK